MTSGLSPFTDVVEAVIEIVLLWWIFYVVLRFLHGTRGLAIMKGVLTGVVAVVLGLILLRSLAGLSFDRLEVAGGYLLQIMLVVLIILFQPELRRGFTRLSEAGVLVPKGSPGRLSELVTAFGNMARRRTGALVVFEQQTGIQGLQDSGVSLDAAASGALLESIFFPRSPLHDGAVIVRDGRIVAASVMLPLTDDPTVSRELGTRHRAAIGVTEETDALAVVVSEESGRISVVHRGRVQTARTQDDLADVLDEHLERFGGGDDA